MLLAIDVGNSSTKLALFKGDELLKKHTIPTERDGAGLERALAEHFLDAITGAIASSVVPELDDALRQAINDRYGVELRLVRTSDDYNLTVLGPVEHAGTDRLVNAFAATEGYGVPVIVVSFGTATVIDAIDGDRRHLGGLIAPGLRTSALALELAASKLPKVEIAKPDNIVGYDTADAIRSGIYHGQIGLVEHCVSKLKAEIGADAKVVATGGFAEMIAAETPVIDAVDENLTVNGLRMLYSHRP